MISALGDGTLGVAQVEPDAVAHLLSSEDLVAEDLGSPLPITRIAPDLADFAGGQGRRFGSLALRYRDPAGHKVDRECR